MGIYVAVSCFFANFVKILMQYGKKRYYYFGGVGAIPDSIGRTTGGNYRAENAIDRIYGK